MSRWIFVFIAMLTLPVANPIASNARQGSFCGGIAGFPCPEGFTCVDDRRDDCDPLAGGADCAGVCIKQQQHDNDCVAFCQGLGHTGRAFGQCVAGCAGGTCRVDADCRTFSNFCEGCSCLALRVSEPDPVCESGIFFNCLVDPCVNLQAVCRDRQCALMVDPGP